MRSHDGRGPMTIRSVAALGAVLLGAGVLTGCGGDDATVSGEPSTETLAPPPGASGVSPSSRVAAGRDAGDYTEAPQPVDPSNAPGYTAPEIGARERGYLAALEDQGVRTEPLSDPLVAAGNTICRIRTTGGAADETTTIADAVAGQISAGGYSDKKVEDLSRIVVEAASGQLCP